MSTKNGKKMYYLRDKHLSEDVAQTIAASALAQINAPGTDREPDFLEEIVSGLIEHTKESARAICSGLR